MNTYKIKRTLMDRNVLAQYSYLILVLYKTTEERFGTYIPYLQTMCPPSELLNNDGNAHYMQVASVPSNAANGYMAQMTISSSECALDIIDYTNTVSQGKAVLYGMN